MYFSSEPSYFSSHYITIIIETFVAIFACIIIFFLFLYGVI